MKQMNFEEAYLAIVEASKDRDTVEIPTILSCVDFSGKKCLEIGCGVLARLAVKVLAAGAASVVCLDNYDETVKKAKKVIEDLGLGDKIDVQLNKSGKKKLPFEDNSFDIVYGAWLPHELVTDKEFLDEIVRVSKENVLLVMPGVDDDLVAMKSIVFPGEKERREGYKEEISGHLRNKGVEISYKGADLRLDFRGFDEIRGVFYCFDFKNEEIGDLEKREEVDSFLRKRVHNMRNSFYCIIGEK
jgi:predicted RNA methylase